MNESTQPSPNAAPPPSSSRRSHDWRSWFETGRLIGLRAAARRPDRRIWLSDRDGGMQVWGEHLGSTPAQRLTEVAGGVTAATITPDGGEIWWFDAPEGDEIGVWRRQPFGPHEPSVPVSPGLEPAQARGCEFDGDVAALGRGSGGTTGIHMRRGDGAWTTIATFDTDAEVVGVDERHELVVVARRDGRGTGWSTVVLRPPAHRFASAASAPIDATFDDAGRGAEPVGLVGHGPTAHIVVIVTRAGCRVPALWSPEHPLDVLELIERPDGDIDTTIHRGEQLVLRRWVRGRTVLSTGHVRFASDGRGRLLAVRPVGFADGTASDCVVRADGRVEAIWSSTTRPPRIVVEGSDPALDDEAVAASGRDPRPVIDVDVAGPGGSIHALVSLPDASGPHPAIVLAHGGPASADRDEWDPARATWAAHGFCVIQVNYRGSTGYGTAWQLANHGRPGEIELADLVAVRDHLVEDGTIDPDRVVLAGRSWGGYLALLGAGLTPELWSLVVAEMPVADTALVYRDMLEEIRAAYRERFGGSPDAVPEIYRRASPLTYVDRISVPVYVSAARHDSRCPIAQIEAWIEAARAVGVDLSVRIHDGGHTAPAPADRIAEMRAQLDFVLARMSV